MPAQKFILERSLLRPADIILSRDKTFISLGVQLGTMGRYSHAALYVGGTAIEATIDGVFSKNPQRMIFNKPTDVLVLRAKKTLLPHEAHVICANAQDKVGSLYALNEAITLKARSLLRRENSKQQFCSRLVAMAFDDAGFDLINLRHPPFCTPRQLSLCKAFWPVKGIVRPAEHEEVEFAHTPDPARENQRQMYEWLDKTRELVKRSPELAGTWDIQTQKDVNEFLVSNPKYDKEISRFAEDSGYLQFYKIEQTQNPFRYNAGLFIFHLSHADEPDEFLDAEIDKEKELVRRYTQMQEIYCQLFQKTGLMYFRQHLVLYTDLVSDIAVRISVIRDVLLKLGLDPEPMPQLLEVLGLMVKAGRKLVVDED